MYLTFAVAVANLATVSPFLAVGVLRLGPASRIACELALPVVSMFLGSHAHESERSLSWRYCS